MGLARRLTGFAVAALLFALAAAPAGAAPRPKIIGGTNAAAGEFPYQVLLDSNGFGCGGSILDGTHVATAAHCVEDINGSGYPEIFDPSTITVFYGGINRDIDGGGADTSDLTPVDVDVVSVDRRRFTRLDGQEYDSAVLTLASNILPHANTGLIQLATSQEVSDAFANNGTSNESRITGWGLTDPNDDSSDSEILQKVQVPLVSNPTCAAAYGTDTFLQSFMLCAGDTTLGGRDTCQGDSGGPLAIDLDPTAGFTPRLAGITSFGEGCGDADFPGVYTRVTEPTTASFLGDTTQVDPPRVAGSPHVTGTARVGQTVTCVPPSLPAGVQVKRSFWYVFSGDTYSLFAGAAATAVLPAAALGKRVECDVRLENAGGYQFLEGTAGAIGPVAAAAAVGPTPPAKDTTKPKAKVSKVRCKRRRCRITIKATDVGGIVKKVSARVKGKYKKCRRVRGKRRCKSKRVNKRLRLKKRKGGLYTARIKLRRGRYVAYARARDDSGNRSKLARKRFRVR